MVKPTKEDIRKVSELRIEYLLKCGEVMSVMLLSSALVIISAINMSFQYPTTYLMSIGLSFSYIAIAVVSFFLFSEFARKELVKLEEKLGLQKKSIKG
jgi:hypothetical protein